MGPVRHMIFPWEWKSLGSLMGMGMGMGMA